MYGVRKGTVTSLEGGRARVQPSTIDGDVTRLLKIAGSVGEGELAKGTEVAYVVFEDMTGVILAQL